jgi:hypothetical protein
MCRLGRALLESDRSHGLNDRESDCYRLLGYWQFAWSGNSRITSMSQREIVT